MHLASANATAGQPRASLAILASTTGPLSLPCSTKSRVLYASPCYTSCKLRWVAPVVRWRIPAMGTRWWCSVLQKKNNMCEIIINDLLLLVISIKSIKLVLYASDMFRFIWSWTCSIINHVNKRGSWYTWNHVTHPAQSYQHKGELLWAWMCHMVWWQSWEGWLHDTINAATSTRSSYVTQSKSR